MHDRENISPPPPGEYSFDEGLDTEVKLRIFKERTRPTSLDEVKQILTTTIKHDTINKQIVFLTMLLDYTEEDQQNVSFNAPSSTGKSYIALEVSKFFPKEDVDIHSYTSPTAFFHELGKLTTKEGAPLLDRRPYVNEKMDEWEKETPLPYKEERDGKQTQKSISDRAAWKVKRKAAKRQGQDEWDAIDKLYTVDLEKRILIFVDQPHDRLLQVLRALLSHDRKLLPVKITDKTKAGGHRTKNIVVKGFPTVFFASANFSMDPQEQTRFWLLSPEMSEKKILDSLTLQAHSIGDRLTFKAQLRGDEGREFLRQRVRVIKEQEIEQIILREEDQTAFLQWFIESRSLSPRHQRDFPRIIALAKAHALLNLFQRERTPDGQSIYANGEDLEAAKTLINKVLDANEIGLPPYIYKFWLEKLEPTLDGYGITREELSRQYREFYRERIGEKARKKMINLLGDAGLIYEAQDPDDKRRMKLYSLQGGGEIKTEEEGPEEPDKDKLLDDIAEYFTKIDSTQADRNHLYAFIEKRHRLTQDEFEAILRGYSELFELDGWTVAIKEGGPHE